MIPWRRSIASLTRPLGRLPAANGPTLLRYHAPATSQLDSRKLPSRPAEEASLSIAAITLPGVVNSLRTRRCYTSHQASEAELRKEAEYLPHVLGDAETTYPLAFRELQLRLFSAAIREKPNWRAKMDNERIREHWTQELLSQEVEQDQINFFFKELEKYHEVEGRLEERFRLPIKAHIDCVWRSDGLVDEKLRNELIEGVKLLEGVPEDQKDWHPNSSKQVLDLVHPSLFPVVYGITKSLRDGSPIAPPPGALEWAPPRWRGERENVNLWSTQYQWLPSDFEVDEKGETTIKSYINNLHPVSHQKLYSTLERIFSRFVPMFNIVTDELKRNVHQLNRINVQLSDNPPKNAYHYPGRGSSVDWDYGWHMGSLSGNMFSEPQFTANINGRRVKVITKLASIHLTPKDPEFRGGSWHVEGMRNERIVATGIYYYDCKNITTSTLAFRQLLPDPDYIPHGDHEDCYTVVYGIDTNPDQPTVQDVGEICTKENRAIVFPNVFHHQVSPFRLVDDFMPGHRKILAFFLCDPHADEVVSSSSVAPQQPAWLSECSAEDLRRTSSFKDVSEEKFQVIIKNMSEPMGIQGAREHRLSLMKERTKFTLESHLIVGFGYSL